MEKKVKRDASISTQPVHCDHGCKCSYICHGPHWRLSPIASLYRTKADRGSWRLLETGKLVWQSRNSNNLSGEPTQRERYTTSWEPYCIWFGIACCVQQIDQKRHVDGFNVNVDLRMRNTVNNESMKGCRRSYVFIIRHIEPVRGNLEGSSTALRQYSVWKCVTNESYFYNFAIWLPYLILTKISRKYDTIISRMESSRVATMMTRNWTTNRA